MKPVCDAASPTVSELNNQVKQSGDMKQEKKEKSIELNGSFDIADIELQVLVTPELIHLD